MTRKLWGIGKGVHAGTHAPIFPSPVGVPLGWCRQLVEDARSAKRWRSTLGLTAKPDGELGPLLLYETVTNQPSGFINVPRPQRGEMAYSSLFAPN